MFGECSEGLFLVLPKEKKMYRDIGVCFKSGKIKFKFQC